MDIQYLQQAAIEIAQAAYVPYSHFPVGAALLCPDGKIITGVNLENTSFNLGLCAERNALSTAITQGYRQFVALAVYSPKAKTFLTPCGACRQLLSEFMPKTAPVYMAGYDRVFVCKTMEELLPFGFCLEDMQS